MDKINALPAAVASKIKTLTERAWFEFARAELASGRNPAKRGTGLHICMEKLLAGGCSRKQLISAFMERLGIAQGTASVNASIWMAVLGYGGLTRGSIGMLTPNPNNARDD